MIEKYCHVLAFDPIHGQNVFVLGGEMEKSASIIKAAAVSDEIAEAIEGLKPEKGIRHVLVNGIGAGEFWSSNRNGDYFPESGLKHGSDDYGYNTFLKGHNFVHHNNKDPKVAVGGIKFAHYNPRMHRCELILATDMGKLARADEDIYKKIAAGEPVDVSMGSKCDFDVCSICSKRSATRNEYCEHLKEAMNQVLDDGRKVYAYTPHPRFFDMSYVTKGADVTAKALHYLDKAASDKTEPETFTLSSEKVAVSKCPDPKIHEAAECEASFQEPEFPADHKQAVALLEATEPRISQAKLAALSKLSFTEVLSTLSHMGMVLCPEEYQYLALSALGNPELADKMASARIAIDPAEYGSWFDPSIKAIRAQTSSDNVSAKVAELVVDLVPSRSVFEPYFTDRLSKIARMSREVLLKCAESNVITKSAAFMTAELAASLALGYLIYRKGVPATESEAIQKVIHNPDMSGRVMTVLIPLIAAGSIVDKMLDTSEKSAGAASEIIAPIGGTYLYSAYAKRKEQQGRPLSGVEHMFKDYPLPLSLAAVGGATSLARRFRGTMPKKAGTISGVTKNAESGLLLALGSGLYRPRASGVLGYLADAGIAEGITLGVGGVKKFINGKSKSKE